ncbi:hypothetical protein, partial [Neisseria musculi]
MHKKAKRLRDEAQKEKDKAERLKREHKKTLEQHIKRASKQVQIVENDNKQLRESLANSKLELARAKNELKIYESMKHHTPSGDVVILENEIIAKLKAENAKPKKTYKPPMVEIERKGREIARRDLQRAALEAAKEKQLIKESNRKAALARHAKTNKLKAQAIREYKDSGLSKNQFAKQAASRFYVSESTMRKNWLQGVLAIERY